MLAASLADPFFAPPNSISINSELLGIIITLNESLKEVCLIWPPFFCFTLKKKTTSHFCPWLPGCTAVPWHRFVSSTTYRLGRWYSTRNLGGADGRGIRGNQRQSMGKNQWNLRSEETCRGWWHTKLSGFKEPLEKWWKRPLKWMFEKMCFDTRKGPEAGCT